MSCRPYDAVLERLKGLHPKVIDLALDRVERLLAVFDHPEQQLPPVVHIAGTNGKGSTLAYLRAMMEAAGRTVHVYTSPHLVRFSERIRVAGHIIGDDDLTALLEECERRNGGQSITFFEITTIAAFLAFARTPADDCLLETGMGGRVDATNVIACPALTILSSLSLDHQAFLGNTLAAIAGEKAGILKPGVPCVCAAQPHEALAVIIARAQEQGVPLFVEGRDWSVEETSAGIHFVWGDRQLDLPHPALLGPHQIHNAGLAVAAALVLGYLPDHAMAEGLRTIEWPARLQRLTQGPLAETLPSGWELWLDGGHNPSAGEMLAQVAEGWADRPLDAIVGMINTKDSIGFFTPLVPHIRSLRTVTIPGEPNTQTADEVAQAARTAGHTAESSEDAAHALAGLVHQEGPARILICGSLYLAGTILAKND